MYIDIDIHTHIHHLYYLDKAPPFRGATAALKASLTKLMKRVTEASSRVEKAGNGRVCGEERGEIVWNT